MITPKTLCVTANGKVVGKNKVDFESKCPVCDLVCTVTFNFKMDLLNRDHCSHCVNTRLEKDKKAVVLSFFKD